MSLDHQKVLDYWFQGEPLGRSQRARWWQQQAEIDHEIRQEFGDLIVKLSDGLHIEWSETAHGRLAAIVCFDQFSRNIYRNSAKAFSFDEKALFLTVEGINLGHDTKLNMFERTFFMMPLMHDESMDSQDRCIEFYESVVGIKGEFNQYVKEVLGFALRHREVIESFGRYPHRNKVLGRQSTEEEVSFLRQMGFPF
ncbi:MAG: DUF924 family protein [Candidatus Endonucleobacter bathymodioli]|uniref:DUF924 family protein n=1 Tax=Candidatus Endonucleibacter bathymodioli TaxID=539814 RepID=A0AA90NS91_9GAMM|nr:DUF924 family protein [Candidatus Endonucleobacter bathymodioli]